MKKIDENNKWKEEFFKLTFYLSEEELAAVDHIIPMTQALYEGIINKCDELGVDEFFQKFILEYPEFLEKYAQKIENELNETEN